LVDETHVVDRDFMKRMKRAGISRSEFIHLEVSTAGNNPDGYGKERFDYGAEVAAGKVENDELCYIAYAAPQDIESGTLTKDEVIRLGQVANPAWGHTIGEDEYLSDWRESKNRTTEMLDFMMYRLNVWQASVNTWLPLGSWGDCGHEYDLPSLYGRECAIGLDLSRTRDMTAAVMAFPEYGEEGIESVLLWPHFWLPREYADKHKHEADFLGWEASGHLQLTDGNEISTGEIYETIEEWSRLFAVKGLYYDPAFATPITQLIEQGLVGSKGRQLLDALQIERFPIPQRGYVMSLAIDEFESRVRIGRIRHPRNSVLDWQMGNASVRDSGGKPVIEKPNRDSVKKVDGVVASLMALHGALSGMVGVVHTACGLHVLGKDEPTRRRTEWDDDDE
jgi:phage terminase large subunit-like protein